jgi:hypothetical protein
MSLRAGQAGTPALSFFVCLPVSPSARLGRGCTVAITTRREHARPSAPGIGAQASGRVASLWFSGRRVSSRPPQEPKLPRPPTQVANNSPPKPVGQPAFSGAWTNGTHCLWSFFAGLKRGPLSPPSGLWQSCHARFHDRGCVSPEMAAILIMDKTGTPGEGTRPTRWRFCRLVGRVPSPGGASPGHNKNRCSSKSAP